MHDRFVRGYIAGTIGGIVMVLFNFILYILGYSETRFLDLVSIIFLGYISDNILEQAIAQIIHTGHAAFTGISFAYLVPKINNNYLKFKGATFGAISWFIIFGVGSLYKVPLFTKSAATTVLTYLFSSTIWGVVAALVLVWFEQHSESTQESRQSNQIIPSPAYKRFSDKNVERLEERLEQDEKLLMQVISEQHKSKRSFLSWFKFW